jgi:hypothetical protein
MKGSRRTPSLFPGEDVIEPDAPLLAEARVVGILRLTLRAPHGDPPANEAGD